MHNIFVCASEAAHATEQVIEAATDLRAAGLSVSAASELLGLPHATAQRLLAGRTPSYETLARIGRHE